MVELNLDRLPTGRSELELDDGLVREDQVLQGHRIEGFSAHVRGLLQVDAMSQKVLVHGSFTARRTMECDRCGEPFELEYPVEVEVLVYRMPGRGTDEEFDESDNWIIYQPTGVVDLTEALLEAVVLDEPQRVVHPEHDDDRRTVVAGEDEDGSNEDELLDPRWEALRRLREGGGGSDRS